MVELKIVDQTENVLLNRNEVRFAVTTYEATPSRGVVKKELCKTLGADPDLVVIDRMDHSFGTREVTGYAKIYKDKAAMVIERDYKLKRDQPKQKAGAAAEAKTEKPAEPKKEG